MIYSLCPFICCEYPLIVKHVFILDCHVKEGRSLLWLYGAMLGCIGVMVPWGHVWKYGAVVENMVACMLPWWDVYGYGAMVAYLGG